MSDEATQPVVVTVPAHGWLPRFYQKPLFDAYDNGCRNFLLIWPRRHGKDMTLINFVAIRALERVGLYWLVYPLSTQGKKIAWNGMDNEGRTFLSAIPDELVSARNNTEMSVTLKNGSIIQVIGANNKDSLVGPNPVGIVYSEYSLMDPSVSDYLDPILEANGGWQAYIYTPRGPNHGKKLLDRVSRDPLWYVDHRTAKELRVLRPEQLQRKRKECIAKYGDDSLFQQEYMCSFEASLAGAYYGHLIEAAQKQGRVGSYRVDPRHLVHTSWDLGVGDSTVIWFWQFIDGRFILVNCYENSGKGLKEYIQYLKSYQDHFNVVYGDHVAPWDIEHRDISTGKSRRAFARALGLKFKVCPKHGVDNRIEAVRQLLPLCCFDERNCKEGLNGLTSYTKEYDDEKRVYKDTPLHDWASHYADSFGYMAMGMSRAMLDKSLKEAEGPDIFMPPAHAIPEYMKPKMTQEYDPRNY